MNNLKPVQCMIFTFDQRMYNICQCNCKSRPLANVRQNYYSLFMRFQHFSAYAKRSKSMTNIVGTFSNLICLENCMFADNILYSPMLFNIEFGQLWYQSVGYLYYVHLPPQKIGFKVQQTMMRTVLGNGINYIYIKRSLTNTI